MTRHTSGITFGTSVNYSQALIKVAWSVQNVDDKHAEGYELEAYEQGLIDWSANTQSTKFSDLFLDFSPSTAGERRAACLIVDKVGRAISSKV